MSRARLASLLQRRRLGLADLGKRLLNWHEWGYLAVDGLVFDVGVQTSQALLNLRAGAEPLEAGLSHERANGNGSLMRSLPLALWHRGTDAKLVLDAWWRTPTAPATCVAYSRARTGSSPSPFRSTPLKLWARLDVVGSAPPSGSSPGGLAVLGDCYL